MLQGFQIYLRKWSRYHQISAICQAFLLNFPLFFSLELVQYLSNDCLVSFMGISPFLSLIYHIQNTINTEKLFLLNNNNGGSVARCWHATQEGGVQFPTLAEKAFHLSHISIVDISGKSHRSTDTYT